MAEWVGAWCRPSANGWRKSHFDVSFQTMTYAMTQTLEPSVRDAIGDVVRQEMARSGLRDCAATLGTDHDGDPVIFVDVDYTLNGDSIDIRAAAGLAIKLRDRLWAIGETRFPHVRHHFLAEQTYVGDPALDS